mmetsp:Transcript_25587/g.37408  ORF Transcript_25587/g.37408 Transcript_25587/m.37408 type:complete len:89 (-) Transcript_25587:539-805(-)
MRVDPIFPWTAFIRGTLDSSSTIPGIPTASGAFGPAMRRDFVPYAYTLRVQDGREKTKGAFWQHSTLGSTKTGLYRFPKHNTAFEPLK